MKRLLLTSLFCLAMSVTFAQQGMDPKQILQDANKYRGQLITDARNAGQAINANDLNAKYKAKIMESLKGVDPTKIESKDALDWAGLYQAAGEDKIACDLCKKYLDEKRTDQERYQAMSMMARSCNALGEADMLAATLADIPVPDAMASSAIVNMSTNLYIDTIFEKKGVEAALSTLDAIQKKIVLEDPKAYAQRMLPMRKRTQDANPNGPKKTDEELLADLEKTGQQMNAGIPLTFATKKAELLSEGGKKKEAIETLSAAIKDLPADSPSARTPRMKLTQMTLIGTGAPDLKFEKGINGATWPGVGALKGKVVILDFFAHWCGPCIASFPDMKKMYADLHDKGLEIYHVTKYYGYFGAERGISKEDEFEKMTGFVQKHELPWPVIYADPSFGDAYGIWGIPHCAVIDKNGIVHKIKVGYSPDSFATFRKEVEAMVGAN